MNEKTETAGNSIEALVGFMAELDKRGEALKRIMKICKERKSDSKPVIDLIDWVAAEGLGLPSRPVPF